MRYYTLTSANDTFSEELTLSIKLATKPLEGLLVLSLEQAVAAPYCSSRLADAGARVIKIERTGGDFARDYDSVAHGQASYFVWLNRGKESLVIDIKSPDDAAFLHRILARADVFIQNLAPGASARAGFGAAALMHKYPRLIAVDISGYGHTGEYADMKAYDLLVQAESGLCAITGGPNEMGRVGVSVCDIACGMYAYAAVLEALQARARTGVGTHLQCSLFHSLADWMAVPLLHHDYGGKAPRRMGLKHPSIHPYGAYETRNGAPVLISIQNEREFADFCTQVLEQPALTTDPRFSSNVARCEHQEALDLIINARFQSLQRSSLLDRLRTARVAYGEVNGVDGLSTHPAMRRIEIDTPGGSVSMPAPPVRFGDIPRDLGPVPSIGEHTAAIKEEFSS